VGFAFDLLPGAAGNAPAGCLQLLLATPIVLEGGVGSMEFLTVGLDDQALISPEKIRLVRSTADSKANVHFGPWEPGATAHSQEEPLKLTASSLGVWMDLVEKHAKSRHSSATAAALDQPAQRHMVKDAQNFRLGDCPPELPSLQNASQIEKRPLSGSARDPTHDSPILRQQRPVSMGLDAARYPPAPLGGAHVNCGSLVLQQTPESRGRSM